MTSLYEGNDPLTPGMRHADAIKSYDNGEETTLLINDVSTNDGPAPQSHTFSNDSPPQVENGTKYDGDKPRLELLDAGWLEDVARVMTFGATKYADHNWRAGLRISRLLGAAMRHLLALLRGEDMDPETGLSHASHLSCCAMFLYWTLHYRKDLDDRWNPSK